MPQPLQNNASLENLLRKSSRKGHRGSESYATENTGGDKDRARVPKVWVVNSPCPYFTYGERGKRLVHRQSEGQKQIFDFVIVPSY